MEASTVTQLWMDLATNAPFVGFLLYQYWDQRKTNKEQRDEMKEIRLEAKQQEEVIRGRFEKVITDLNRDRDQLVDGFSSRIDSLERGQKKLFAILEPLKEQIQEIRIKEKVKEQMIQ
jgi:hypothetical protein|tara:strand:+ start:2218 stop:2571 length:354 start_codon:yes stop_codon:yes gene_type:complete